MEINIQASKVNWRPIEKYRYVPVGCVGLFIDENGDTHKSVCLAVVARYTLTHYAIIELPVVKRKLRRCPFPTCDNSDLEIAQFGCIRFCVQCRNCDSHGPIENTPERAKESWGYE